MWRGLARVLNVPWPSRRSLGISAVHQSHQTIQREVRRAQSDSPNISGVSVAGVGPWDKKPRAANNYPMSPASERGLSEGAGREASFNQKVFRRRR